jgi:superfamily II DNA or RNA helicase
MSDTELHLFLPALGLKADARAVRTRFNQGLDIGEAVRESAAEESEEELSAEESAALLNDAAPDTDDERPPEDKLQDELDGMDAIQSAIDKTTPLHRDRLAPIVETIVATRVNGFWQTVFDAEYDGRAVAPIVRKVKGMTPNSQIAKDVQQRFLEEFAEVAKIKAPKVYRGHKLRLMQRRIMHLLAYRPYLGNWSGTGSGKTIAALCSALHVDSKLSVVVCPNPVKSTWLAEIKNVFGERIEVAAPSSGDDWAATTGRILVLNYECFQQEYSEAKVQELLAQRGHEIGLFILDECHYAKLDESAPKESERRKVITAFMNGVPGAKRLAMSATPVVNNLSEAKRLIETLTGEAPTVSTRPTVANCIAMYQELVKYGIRWRSEYREIKVLKPEIVAGVVVGPTVVNIDAGDGLHASLLEEKKRLGKAFTPLVIDQMTLPFKLDAIVASVGKREKAIVYTEYKEGVVDVIVGAFKKKGYKVAAFDGDTSEEDRADVLADFQGSKVNVVVATSAITTGIDGLQHCRKMIIASLPFTHARFMQLLGRIVRPTADKSPRTVEIVLPLVTTMGWSGDVIRFKRIASKGSISASAIDGTVPTFDDSSRRELERSIVKALEQSSEAPTSPAV